MRVPICVLTLTICIQCVCVQMELCEFMCAVVSFAQESECVSTCVVRGLRVGVCRFIRRVCGVFVVVFQRQS